MTESRFNQETENSARWILGDRRDYGNAEFQVHQLDDGVGLTVYGRESAFSVVLEDGEAEDVGESLIQATQTE